MKDHDFVFKFLDLLQTQDKKQLRNTALYLKLAEKSRLESRVMLCMYIWYFKRCTLYKLIEINSVLLCSQFVLCVKTVKHQEQSKVTMEVFIM